MKTDQGLLTGRAMYIASSHLVVLLLVALTAVTILSFGSIILNGMSSTEDISSGIASSAKLVLDSEVYDGIVNFNFENQAVSRKLLYAISDSKKEMLDGLEGAVLEPPTNKKFRRRTKYLPELMGDSLASYPRRVFVDVGPVGRVGSEGWFKRHYPKRDLDFDIIRVDEVGNNGKEEGMSEWLRRNVKDEEYVVMKAEAEVVLEMMKGKMIGLVDELFLECTNQWHKGKRGGEVHKSRRAYWECLALYGRLKDEGIAVHQWWD